MSNYKNFKSKGIQKKIEKEKIKKIREKLIEINSVNENAQSINLTKKIVSTRKFNYENDQSFLSSYILLMNFKMRINRNGYPQGN